MRVLFDCAVPFSFAHGGQQVQIEQTQASLRAIGVKVEPLRWWDEHQKADIYHYFGRPPIFMIEAARRKGMKVISSALEGGLGAKPGWYRFLLRGARKVLGPLSPGISRALMWNSHKLSDATIALTAWEAHLVETVHGVQRSRVFVVPNGVEDVFLQVATSSERGAWLVCTATIIELKQVLKLAQAAVAAQVPVWFIGKPYAESDAYFKQFVGFARRNPNLVRYDGPIESREQLAGIYRQARGFVLLSRWESLSLSALEAAACGCPLLLSDLPWARSHFGQHVTFCHVGASVSATAARLRDFHTAAPSIGAPPKPLSWIEIAEQLQAVYKKTLGEPEHRSQPKPSLQ